MAHRQTLTAQAHQRPIKSEHRALELAPYLSVFILHDRHLLPSTTGSANILYCEYRTTTLQ